MCFITHNGDADYLRFRLDTIIWDLKWFFNDQMIVFKEVKLWFSTGFKFKEPFKFIRLETKLRYCSSGEQN